MASIMSELAADDLRLRELQQRLRESESALSKLDELEAKLQEIRSRKGETLQQIKDSREELKQISKGVKEVSRTRLTELTPMANMTELEAADTLAESLERGGLRLKKRLPAIADEVLKTPRATTKDLRDALVDAVFSEAGKMAPDMARFLGQSLGSEFVEFAQPDYGILYGSADDILSKVVLYGKDHASEFSGTLSKFVLDQVDRTQDASRFVFTRHAEAGACSWCRAQVSNYEITGQFLRHANCRCMKVRR